MAVSGALGAAILAGLEGYNTQRSRLDEQARYAEEQRRLQEALGLQQQQFAHSMEMDEAKLGLSRDELGLARERAEREAKQQQMRDLLEQYKLAQATPGATMSPEAVAGLPGVLQGTVEQNPEGAYNLRPTTDWLATQAQIDRWRNEPQQAKDLATMEHQFRMSQIGAQNAGDMARTKAMIESGYYGPRGSAASGGIDVKFGQVNPYKEVYDEVSGQMTRVPKTAEELAQERLNIIQAATGGVPQQQSAGVASAIQSVMPALAEDIQTGRRMQRVPGEPLAAQIEKLVAAGQPLEAAIDMAAPESPMAGRGVPDVTGQPLPWVSGTQMPQAPAPQQRRPMSVTMAPLGALSSAISGR